MIALCGGHFFHSMFGVRCWMFDVCFAHGFIALLIPEINMTAPYRVGIVGIVFFLAGRRRGNCRVRAGGRHGCGLYRRGRIGVRRISRRGDTCHARCRAGRRQSPGHRRAFGSLCHRSIDLGNARLFRRGRSVLPAAGFAVGRRRYRIRAGSDLRAWDVGRRSGRGFGAAA